jgi:hypothetical protein
LSPGLYGERPATNRLSHVKTRRDRHIFSFCIHCATSLLTVVLDRMRWFAQAYYCFCNCNCCGVYSEIRFFSRLDSPSGRGLLYEVPRSHSDTPHSAGLLWTCDRPVAETSSLITHNTHKRQTYMPPEGFETAISVRERP